MTKSILVDTTFMDLGDMTMFCMTFWTLYKRSTTFSVRKPYVSKTKWKFIKKLCAFQNGVYL